MNSQRLEFLNGVKELVVKIFKKDIFEICDYKDYISVTIHFPKDEKIENLAGEGLNHD